MCDQELKHRALLLSDVLKIYDDWFVPGLRINMDILRIFKDLITFDFIEEMTQTDREILEGYQKEKEERKLTDFDTTYFVFNYKKSC